MPRLIRDRFAVECIQEFDRAATERYADAGALARAGRRTGAIYLYGYVVEMLLKAAYFRLIHHGDNTPIGVGDMRLATGVNPASTARSLGLDGTQNLHDLTTWGELIVAYRNRNGLLYTGAGFARFLTVNVAIVRGRWTETIRYHKNIAYRHELDRVTQACDWIVEHRYEI